LDRMAATERAGDRHAVRTEPLGYVAVRLVDAEQETAGGLFHIVELRQEVGVPQKAAVLAVGDALEAQVLLRLRHLGDRLVLDLAELLRRDLALRLLLARVEHIVRT